MQPNTYETLAHVAADWWTSKFEGDVKFDNGANDISSAMASALASKSRQDLNPAQIEIFRSALSVIIRNKLQTSAHIFRVHVDYRPDENLSLAMKEAMIPTHSMTLLPWKTFMDINKETGAIIVREGYGAAPVSLTIPNPQE